MGINEPGNHAAALQVHSPGLGPRHGQDPAVISAGQKLPVSNSHRLDDGELLISRQNLTVVKN